MVSVYLTDDDVTTSRYAILNVRCFWVEFRVETLVAKPEEKNSRKSAAHPYDLFVNYRPTNEPPTLGLSRLFFQSPSEPSTAGIVVASARTRRRIRKAIYSRRFTVYLKKITRHALRRFTAVSVWLPAGLCNLMAHAVLRAQAAPERPVQV